MLQTRSSMPAVILSPATVARQLHLLSNGAYSVMLSDSGSGFSRWRDLASRAGAKMSRATPRAVICCCAMRTAARCGRPRGNPSARRRTCAFVRREGTLSSILEIAVAADADVELRRLVLHNHGDTPRTLSLTSYTELVLGPAGADHAHPAFSKLFVQTEWHAPFGVLLATRRQRAYGDPVIWAAHALQTEGQPVAGAQEHEADRAHFLGRCRTLRDAQTMQPGAALSNTTGYVLDPIFSLRQHVILAPGASVRLLLWTRLADSREGALTFTAQLENANAAEQLFAGAAIYSATEHARLGIDAAQAARSAHWLGALLISDPRQRAAAAALAPGRGGAPTLWAAGISGDRPTALLRAEHPADLPRVQELLLAQREWRSQRLAVDVVLLNTAAGADADALHRALAPLVSAQQALITTDRASVKAELFALRDDALSDELRNGLLTAARVLLDTNESVATTHVASPVPGTAPAALRASTPAHPASPAVSSLEFANGTGGFSGAGRTYQIRLDEMRCACWLGPRTRPAQRRRWPRSIASWSIIRTRSHGCSRSRSITARPTRATSKAIRLVSGKTAANAHTARPGRSLRGRCLVMAIALARCSTCSIPSTTATVPKAWHATTWNHM